jgi:predicted amidohydrolase YtcJ
MLAKGVHVSAGTDATRVASYNPWVSLAWLITGKTVGGMRITPQRNCLDRERRCACGPRRWRGSPTRKAARA